jgi:uncharacterized protein YciI
MKIANLLPLMLGLILLFACEEQKNEQLLETEDNEQTYDSLLALKLGADDYGMRKYVMAFLKSGPNRSQDSIEAINLQKAHLENITRLAEEGSLVFAGPFMDDTEVRGIYIFAVSSLEEAAVLTESDPAVKAGRLIMELHPFYGSAALMQVNEIHSKISREPI